MVDCSRSAQSLNKLADYEGEASKIVVQICDEKEFSERPISRPTHFQRKQDP